MTTSQFFVYKRPIAWTALVATLAWGLYAYLAMPQRQDPAITSNRAVVLTAYPGARAEKVEQEVSRKIEKAVAQNASVEEVTSLSRQGLSVVYVKLFDTVKDTEPIWQDLRAKLTAINDLPRVGLQQLKPHLDKDFGETVAVMLTISSPPVSDFEVSQRARAIQEVLEPFRAARPDSLRSDRVSGVLVYPNTVARSYVIWIGQTLLRHLTESGVIRDGHIVEAPSTGCIDFQLARSEEELHQAVERWFQETFGTGITHPDMWQGFFIRDLSTLPPRLRAAATDRYSYRELRLFADRIHDRLKQSPTVGKIEAIGVQEEEVYLYYSGQRMNRIGVTPHEVFSIVQATNINLPGGRVELPKLNVVVAPTGEFTSEQAIGEVVLAISPQGYPMYLRDVAEIVRGYQDPPSPLNSRTIKVDRKNPKTARLPGEMVGAAGHISTDLGDASIPADYRLQTTRAITLAIRQVKGVQVAQFGHDIDQALSDLAGVLPDDLQIERTSNEPRQVRQKIRHFGQSFLEAIAIVILVSLLLMEWRAAMLVAISIPVTVAMTLGICHLLGVDLQQVSIAALIIALGLLVDDPVVAGDAINRELAHGVKPDVAAWLGPQKLARAILFATLTNIVAFLPLLLVQGRIGEFIWSLPVVVTASLISSRVVSMTFMPLLGYYLLRGQRGFESSDEAGRQRPFARMYRSLAEKCLRWRWPVIATCLLLLGCGIAALPLVGTAFFPRDRHNVFTVNLHLPEGAPIRQAREQAGNLIETIDQLEGASIQAYTTFVGAGGPRFWLSVVPEQRADNYAQVLVHTLDEAATAQIVQRLKQSLPPKIAGARVAIEQLETGPPVGVPVQVRLRGPDIAMLRKLAEQTKSLMRQIPGTTNIHDDWDADVLQISLDIEPDRANMTGITNQDVAAVVNAGLSGTTVTQLRDDDRLIPVTVRLRSDERSRVEDLFSINVLSALTDAKVPLRQIASFKTEFVTPKIRRRNHERCLTVLCDTVPGLLPSQVVRQLREQALAAKVSWPAGYRFEFGGEREEQAKGFRSVAIALVVSLAAIYLALVLQFNSIAKPLLVFAAVPFGTVGGLMGLLISGQPFGFMAFLGIASLAGVIVSHIIVLFDFIEEMHEKGEPLRQAVVDAALVRLRPVVVTVLATVGGLIPLAIEGGPLWQPMCYVQIVGLLVATAITLVIVPVLYVIFAEDLRIVRWEAVQAEDRGQGAEVALQPASPILPSDFRPLPSSEDPEIARLMAARRAAG